MKEIKLKLTGESPLLMHNDILADPLSDEAKALKSISSRRNKTEDDHLEMSRTEFMGGLYYNPESGPVLPARLIRASLLGGAKKTKGGTQVKSGLLILDDSRLEYKGPRGADELWNAGFFLRVSVKNPGNAARVQRTRPMFRNWSVTAVINYDETVLDLDRLLQWADDAGRLVGIGDWRPATGGYYGRYTVEVV